MIQYQRNLIKFSTILKMSFHRLKLAQIQPNSQSFIYLKSINQHQESKLKKKRSVYQKLEPCQYTRVKTDEKQPISIIKQQHYIPSINLLHQNNSASKLSGGKLKSQSFLQNKKIKKNSKYTISIINLTKNIDQFKVKGSSTITKRKQSARDFNQKLKQKIGDFRIVSNCMEEYVKEQKRNANQVNLLEIIRIISAFNRSEIAPVSKLLQKLIAEIIKSIQSSIPVESKLKSFQKKSISFERPSKKHDHQDVEIKSTVKKGQISGQFILKKNQHPEQERKLDENLGKLKYESNRLKYFLEEMAPRRPEKVKQKHEDKRQMGRDKIEQLQQLSQIVRQQEKIIKKLEDSSSQGTFRSDSAN